MSYVVKCFVIMGIVLAYFIDSFRIKKDIEYINTQIEGRENI